MGNRHRQEKLAQCRQLLQMNCDVSSSTDSGASSDYRDRYAALTGLSLHQCPICRCGRMLTVEQITRSTLPPLILDTS